MLLLWIGGAAAEPLSEPTGAEGPVPAAPPAATESGAAPSGVDPAAPPPASAASAPAPTEPADSPASAPAAPGPDAAPVAAPAEAQALYLDALQAWRTGSVRIALQKARAAQAAAPDGLEPAALLEGYALLREREYDAGAAKLKLLAETAVDAEVRQAARKAYSRAVRRQSRDDPSMQVGFQVAGRPTSEALALGGGYSAGYDHPIAGGIGFAVEVSGYDTSARTPVIEGPIVDLLGSVHLPFRGTNWAARLKAGPALWVSHGAVYGAEVVPNVGTRVVLGIDSRPWSGTGFYLDVGGWMWPGLAETLPAFQLGVDARFGIVWWISPPAR